LSPRAWVVRSAGRAGRDGRGCCPAGARARHSRMPIKPWPAQIGAAAAGRRGMWSSSTHRYSCSRGLLIVVAGEPAASVGGDALARWAEQAREWQLEQPRLQIPQCHSTAEIVVAAMPARLMLRTARAIAPAAARNVEGAAADDDGAREHVSDDRAGRGSTVIPARPERPPPWLSPARAASRSSRAFRQPGAHPPPTTGTRLRQRHDSDLGRRAPDDPRRPGVRPVREPGNDGSGHAPRHRHAAGFPRAGRSSRMSGTADSPC
jgi:hypothetical protein